MKGYDRRSFLTLGGLAGSALVLGACAKGAVNENVQSNSQPTTTANSDKTEPEEKEVSTLEDLMREHGVLRRALLIYTHAAMLLRNNPSDVSPTALHKTAKLFRVFGEDYHEKKLEEQYIFPLIKQKGAAGKAAVYPVILMAQHDRGREITDHIISVTNTSKLGADAETFAGTLEAFVWMYRNHAAREDTIVFPAWKSLISEDDYKELGEKFEEIETEQFGGDGFDMAVDQIGDIEESLGLSDISKFTAPAPMGK